MSIYDFIRTGVVKGIRAGSLRKDVIEAFGEPEAVELVTRKGRRPAILKYGALEVTVDEDDRVWLLSVECWDDSPSVPPAVGLDLDPLAGWPSADDVAGMLKEEGIRHRVLGDEHIVVDLQSLCSSTIKAVSMPSRQESP